MRYTLEQLKDDLSRDFGGGHVSANNSQRYKGGGGGGSQTVTQTQQLPKYAQPYAIQLMERGAGLSNKEYTPYQGQRIAELNNNQNTALGMTANQAMNGFQGQGDVGDLYQRTVRGDYLTPDSNPYLRATADAIGTDFNRTVGAQNASMQRTAGAFGNSGLQQKMSMDNAGLAGKLNDLYSNNYNMERSNQLQAMQLAPQMQNMGYTDAKQLLGVGDIQRSYTQDLLNQNLSDWTAAQNQPYANLDILQKAISGSIGNAGTSMQTSANPYQANGYASMLGGGLTGAALGSALFGNNTGTALGAGAGALGSLLF
jgi:hypothetical protein